MLQSFTFPPEPENARDRHVPPSFNRHLAPRPIAPAPPGGRALHRRGLSLDQGVARHQQNASIYGQEAFDWSRWLDIGDYNINNASESLRPRTPIHQTDNEESFLLTPATTPCWKSAVIPPRNCRTAHSSPTKKAPPPLLPRNVEPMQRAKSSQGPADGYYSQQDIPPFQDAPLFQLPEHFDSKLSRTDDDIFTDLTFHHAENSDPFTLGDLPSPIMTSFSSLHELPKQHTSELAVRRGKKVPIAPAAAPTPAPATLLPTRPRTGSASGCSSPIKAALAPRVVTIADLKLDASIDASLEETGVTLEDICGYIEGPDPADNKWQRGMCSGAFVGAVRRAERRGRPRKDRPKFEERREKATRARQRERKKAPSPPVQDSSSSSSSSAPSPESDSYDAPSTREHSPAKEMLFLDMDSIALPPDVFTFTPPASPSYSTGNIGSPARSYYSTSQEPEENRLCLSPSKRYLADIPEEILELPPLDCGSPTPVKRESKRDLTGSPCRTLWPANAGSTLTEASSGNDFDDVFSSQASTSTFDPDQLPPLGPQSTTGISESGSSQYDDDIFLSQLNGEGANLDNDYFPLSLSPNTDAFFDSFTTELK
ncbi:uncharacterized protein GIQ15_00981 [Arthroderma uncinatum]|uniref:uncharacterized protein n=1 Tax=Arthroderma uncinatum TaxID=74035 RepID=UPI00144A5F2E|nr:uncharacterized protein GIQ15_00981 [Arthroderma uncinatum]KAF3491464.1 hypothetical protein GIQ15_00981 [Arthroderma uncinatum]